MSKVNFSVEKALDIVEYLAQRGTSATLSVVSNALGMNRATANSLLHTLQALGYLTQDSSRGYYLTAKLFQLGMSFCDSHPAIQLLKKHEKILMTTYQASVCIYLPDPDGQCMLMYSKIFRNNTRQKSSNTLIPSAGSTLPLHCTAAGKVLLAFLSDCDYADFWNAGEPFKRYTKNTITDIGALRSEVEKTRQQGYGVDRNEYESQRRCIAVPIFNAEGKLSAVFSMNGEEKTMAEKEPEIVALMKSLATRVTSQSEGTGRTLEGDSRRIE